MGTIALVVVHCSANRSGSAFRMADIGRLHRSWGWEGCGYHYVIPTDGTIEAGRPEAKKGAHSGPRYNPHSIGVCYIGGLAADGVTPQDTRTEAQKRSLRKLLEELHARYPKALILGHRDLSLEKPHCPGFNVVNEYWDLEP